jgi:nucleotide-binding universal stress UspA family protein
MKFVVGIDGSETASVAAARAGELALKGGGSVHVVCAYSGRGGETFQVGSDSFVVSNLTTAEQIAEQQAAAFRSQGIDSTSVAIDAKPADALIDEAERLIADVIVVGNRRMQGMKRILGAVANDVAHRAPCDVLIVKTT